MTEEKKQIGVGRWVGREEKEEDEKEEDTAAEEHED